MCNLEFMDLKQAPLFFHDATVYLKFDVANYTGRICSLPDAASDPALVDGTFNRLSSNNYWAQIFIDPICGGGRSTQEYWIRQNPDRSWPVKIPSTIACKITVSFHEGRNGCSGYTGRPLFEFTSTLTGFETNINAFLTYQSTTP